MVMPDDTTTPCLVKRGLLSATDTEWEPLASPMRDLFSSVGYSSKGREVELQGRAISLAYGDYKKPDSYDDYPSTERSYGDGPSSYNDYPSSKGGYSGPFVLFLMKKTTVMKRAFPFILTTIAWPF